MSPPSEFGPDRNVIAPDVLPVPDPAKVQLGHGPALSGEGDPYSSSVWVPLQVIQAPSGRLL